MWSETHSSRPRIIRSVAIQHRNPLTCSSTNDVTSLNSWFMFPSFIWTFFLQMYRWPLISSRCKQRPDRDVAVVGATGQRLLESYYWTRWRLGAARFLLSALICSQQLALRRNEVATNFGSYFVLSKRIEFLAEAGPLFRVFEAEAGRSSDAVTNQDSETIGPPSRTKFDEKKFDC